MFVSLAGQKDSYQNEKFMRGCRFLEAELQEMDRVLSGRYVLIHHFFFSSSLTYTTKSFQAIDLTNISRKDNVVELCQCSFDGNGLSNNSSIEFVGYPLGNNCLWVPR